MIGLYILAGIIIFFILLLQVSTSIRVSYNSAKTESFRIYAKIGFYKLNIIPLKPKKTRKIKKKRFKLFRRKKDKKIVKKKDKNKQIKEKKKDKLKYTVKEIIEFSKDLGFASLKKIRKYLRIKIYKMNIKVGAEDAYKTAMLYANLNQAAYYLYEILRNNFNLKAQNINISSDFLSEKVSFDIDIKAGIKISGSLNMLIAMAIHFMKLWSKSKKNSINIKKESVEINGGQ